MKKARIMLKGITTLSLLLCMAGGLSAQSLSDAINEYNQGAQILKTDPDLAAIHFERCIEISDQLGAEGSDTRGKAVAALARVPGVYFSQAMTHYRERDFDRAIQAFEKAAESASKYGDEETGRKARAAIPQLYYAKGIELYKNKDFEGAIVQLEKAIELNPNYGKAFMARGLAYKGLDDLEKMKESMDQAMAVSAGRDAETMREAEESVRNSYYNAGVTALQNEAYREAEAYFDVSIEYGNNDPDIFLKLGEINNELGDPDKAIQYLERGIGLSADDAAARAGFYYHMGNAYQAKGDKTKACEAYRKAMHGQYLENAKYQVENVLKCDG
ncbi:MAG TPA: tetratricopeptide repeat protein [Bacteroidetes bacterium]|nr:tetratricopeptide repeat protein [Bacteroidota bacterium]